MINDDVMRLMEVQRSLHPIGGLSELARSSMLSNYERSIAMMGGLDQMSMLSAAQEAQRAFAALSPHHEVSNLAMATTMTHVYEEARQATLWADHLSITQRAMLSSVSALQELTALKVCAGLDTIKTLEGLVGHATLGVLQQSLQTTQVASDFVNMQPVVPDWVQGLSKSILARTGYQMAVDAVSTQGAARFHEYIGIRPTLVKSAVDSLYHMQPLIDAESMARTAAAMSVTSMLRDSLFALSQRGIAEEVIAHFNTVAWAHPAQVAIDQAFLSPGMAMPDPLDGGKFLAWFKELPAALQWLIVGVLLQFVIPQFNTVFSELVTMPFVKKVLHSDRLSIEQMRVYKKVPALQGIDTTHLRFITRSGVRLRAAARTNAESLDELVIGQIVTVLNKKKNWAEVVYQYEDGQTLRGWVLLTCTARFKR